jgi:hypothetical protein
MKKMKLKLSPTDLETVQSALVGTIEEIEAHRSDGQNLEVSLYWGKYIQALTAVLKKVNVYMEAQG